MPSASNPGTPIIEDLTLHIVPAISSECKIQGDGRTFLGRFKSYFGSQISSQSFNEIHIIDYSQNLLQKMDLKKNKKLKNSLIVNSSQRMLPFDV